MTPFCHVVNGLIGIMLHHASPALRGLSFSGAPIDAVLKETA